MTDVSPAEAVFFAALAKVDPAERAAYLNEACGADVELRRRVDRLLEAHPQVGSFLQEGAAVVPAPLVGEGPGLRGGATVDLPLVTERAGTVIGPYKLLQQIGEGGMGTVWMAEQTQPVQRKVALKVIKPGMDSRQVIARFEAERQALAMMDHVNIARVFDAGTTEAGRPYFVMELVHGVPITKYCDDNHLTPRERLELFVPVCQAIQHAHQKGIIHRDVKPSNVMITLYDGKPVPKVIDFGVAKATEQKLTERTLFTQYGTMVGTLEYMSPEQAEMSALGVDTRSDIYSLGVLLYELLTGSTPLTHKRMKEAAYAEILRMIKEEEPQKPSTRLSDSGEALASISAQRHMEPAKLTKLVRGELDWIVMKTLEKDRNRRYETANGFAADVQRYLNDEPVQACPPSAWYRWCKFARRHRRTLATLTLLAVVLMAALGAVGGMAGWMLHERDEQERRADEERRELQRRADAEQKERQRRADDEKKDRQRRAAVEIERAVKQANELQAARRSPEALAYAEHAQDILDRIDGQDELRPLVADLLKDLHVVRKLEEVAMQKSDLIREGFKTGFQRPKEHYWPVFRDYGLDVLALDVQVAAAKMRARPIVDHLIEALDDWSRYEPDQPTRERLRAIVQAAQPKGVLAQWRAALDRRDFAELRLVLAGLKMDAVPPGTLAYLGRSAAEHGLLKEALDVLRAAYQRHPGDFWINNDLAYVNTLLKPPQWDEALRHYTAALAVRGRSPTVYTNIGSILAKQGKEDDAFVATSKALELKPDHAMAHNNAGILLALRGKFEEAEAALRRAIQYQAGMAPYHNNLARVLAQSPARKQEAIEHYEKALALDKTFANAYSGRGRLWLQEKEIDKAEADFRKAIACNAEFAEAHNGLGSVLREQRHYAAAIESHENALRLDPTWKEFHLDAGLVYAAWARHLAGQGNQAAARVKFDQAITTFGKGIALTPNHPKLWYAQGNALRDRGLIQAALAAFEKAADLKPEYAEAHYNRGNLFMQLGQYPRAVTAYRAALKAKAEYFDAAMNLGSALLAQGKFAEAEKELSKAIAGKPDDTLGMSNYALSLDRQGRYAEAIAFLKPALARLPKGARDRKDLQNLQAMYQEFADLQKRLPAFLSGAETPANAEERLQLGEVCIAMKHYAAAVAFYRDAFAMQPAAANDLEKAYRIDAARAAARAGAGLDKQVAAAELPKLRHQALAWLRADLTLWTQLADQKEPAVAPAVIRGLQGWRRHDHFAGVRGDAIDALPPDERAAWRQLWTDVDALLERLPIP